MKWQNVNYKKMSIDIQIESLMRKSVALQLSSIIAVSMWGDTDPEFAALCKKDFDTRNQQTVNQLSNIKNVNYATTKSNEKESKTKA